MTGCSGNDRTGSDVAPDPGSQTSRPTGKPTPQPTDHPTDHPTEDGASLHDVLPDFTSSVQPVGPEVRARMTSSHRTGCPVTLDELRYLTVRYVGFDGRGTPR